MTGIILYGNDDMPVLHSDTFLSASSSTKKPKIPSRIHSLNTTPIIGLCQKVVIVNGHTAYAWAGSLIQAIGLDQIIRSLAEKLSAHQLMKEVDRATSNRFNDLAFVVIVKIDSTTNLLLHREFSEVDLSKFGRVLVSGSGGGNLYGELGTLSYDIPDDLRELNSSSKRESDRNTRWRLAEGVLQCRFVNQVFRNNVTGGIVETLVIQSPVIEKVPTTFFVFFHRRYGNAQGVFPTVVIKRFYYDGLLCISYFDIPWLRRERYVIPPPHRYGRTHKVPDHLFDLFDSAPIFVTCIYERNDGGHRYYLERGDFFINNFGFISVMDLFYISRSYHDDMMSRRRVLPLP